ncbi:MAG: hypothetical protein CMJ18_10125 [Phycisphaeraceae bacterium]|nr:hypothetical protein [Phycisphaeraceae bacterium]
MEKTGFRISHEPLTNLSADDQWHYWSREPVLRSMPDGRLICWVASGGPREGDKNNVVLITRSWDRGETWTTPEVFCSHEGRAVFGTEHVPHGRASRK